MKKNGFQQSCLFLATLLVTKLVFLQAAWRQQEADEKQRRIAVSLTDAHYDTFAALLGIQEGLPERYHALLQRILVDMQENPGLYTQQLDNAESDSEDFILSLVWNVVFNSRLNEDKFVTLQFPKNKEGIRFVFGGFHVGENVIHPEHVITVVNEIDEETQTIRNRKIK